MDAVGTLKLLKYARIIKGFAEQMKIPYAKAMDLFFHSLTFCPMDNRSTFFLPFIPQTHTAVVSCCNGRRSLPPFPLYAWAYHFMESPLSPRPVFTQQRYGERTACQVPLRYSG